MFTDFLRRSMAPVAHKDPLGGQVSSQSMGTTPSVGFDPSLTMQHFMRLLQQSPGMTPELLRAILADHKRHINNPPIIDPKMMVAGANYRQSL